MGFNLSRDVFGGAGTTGRDVGAKFGEFTQFRNELLTGPGGFSEQLAGLRDDEDLRRAREATFNLSTQTINQLESNLIGGALGSTGGGQVAALEAARVAAGGRGGLAFGGGATRVAQAGARAVAPQQAAALAQALTQVGGLRLQNFQNQAAFAFNRRAQELQLRQTFLSGAFSLSGNAQASLQSAQTVGTQAQSQFASSLIGAGSHIGSAFAGKG